MVTNGIVAQDAAQADALWAVRERITEALQHDGTVYKYDISLPLPQLYSLVCFLWCAHLFVCAFVCVHVRVSVSETALGLLCASAFDWGIAG